MIRITIQVSDLLKNLFKKREKIYILDQRGLQKLQKIYINCV